MREIRIEGVDLTPEIGNFKARDYLTNAAQTRRP